MQGQGARDRREGPRQAVDEGAARARAAGRAPAAISGQPHDASHVSNHASNAPTMRAIEIAGFGGPEVLREVVRARPVAGAGEALVRVTASGVNRPDVLQRKGHYPVPPGASDLPGLELAGDDRRRRCRGAGRRPASPSATASARWWPAAATPSTARCRSARCCRCPRASATSRPPRCPRTSSPCGRTCSTAAAWPPANGCWCRAARAASASRRSSWARRSAPRSSPPPARPTSARRCIELGADHAIDYRTEDFAARALEITGGKGVDVVLDMVAGDYVAREVVLPGRGRPHRADRGAGRHQGAGRRRPGAAQAPHAHRLDAASASGRVQGGDRGVAARQGVAAAEPRARCSR